jgi:methylenetetrahydrofolate dehydrogenase (NADP+)/methenyltetrahydrofolate cyclohydrolase
MAATMLDGSAIATTIKAEVANQVSALKTGGLVPGLAVVLVGEDPASQVYTRNKVRTCQK